SHHRNPPPRGENNRSSKQTRQQPRIGTAKLPLQKVRSIGQNCPPYFSRTIRTATPPSDRRATPDAPAHKRPAAPSPASSPHSTRPAPTRPSAPLRPDGRRSVRSTSPAESTPPTPCRRSSTLRPAPASAPYP